MKKLKQKIKQYTCPHWLKRTGDPKWFIMVSKDGGWYKRWRCKRCGYE